jgi:hypothetical protein
VLRTLLECGPDVTGLEPFVIDDASREDRAQYLCQRRQKFTESIPLKDQRPKRDSMSLEEATVSNMWEIAAIVEVLERKGLCTKQDRYGLITEFRRLLPVKTARCGRSCRRIMVIGRGVSHINETRPEYRLSVRDVPTLSPRA